MTPDLTLDHYVADHPQADVMWHCKARLMPSGELCPVREACEHFKTQSFNFVYDRYAPEPCGPMGCRYYVKVGLPDQKEVLASVKGLLKRGPGKKGEGK